MSIEILSWAGTGWGQFYSSLLTIAVFFFLDRVARGLYSREGFVILDVALFAMLHSGFILTHEMLRGHSSVFQVSKTLIVVALYLVLLSQFNEVNRLQDKKIAKVFDDEKMRALDSGQKVRALSILHNIAIDYLWLSIVRNPSPPGSESAESVAPEKYLRAKRLTDLMQIIVRGDNGELDPGELILGTNWRRGSIVFLVLLLLVIVSALPETMLIDVSG